MNLFARLPLLAQVDLSRFPPLESGWPENAWIAGVVYLVLVGAGLVIDLGLMLWLIRHPRCWAEHVRRLQWRPWTERAAGTLMLVLLALYFLSAVLDPLVRALARIAPTQERMLWIIVHSLFFHLAGLAFVVFMLVRRRMSWRSAFGFDRRAFFKHLGLGVMFYVSALPFLAFYSLLYQAGLKYMGYHVVPQEVAVVFTGEESVWMRVYLAALASVLAPIFEEILFRGIALPLFAQKWGVAPAIILVSLAFALVHFHLPSLVPLFVIAVAFSLGYIYSESILVPIVMHGVFNAVNLGLLTLLRGA